MTEEDRLIQDRIKKLKEIKEMGIDPYPYRYDKTHDCSEILNKHQSLKQGEKTETLVSVAGRILLIRKMGKALFMHIQDQTGKLQLYFRQDDIGKQKYDFIKKLDIGDIIGTKGKIFKTKTGEITVHIDDFVLLAKSIRPLPEKYHGLQDKELRYRQRYLDLIMNPEVKERFLKRTKIIHTIKEVLEKHGFIEVETPTLQPIYGGAFARPFVTKHNTLDMTLYLRISNELYLKRLLVGGFEKVYEFVKDFRNEGIDRTHNPEFTQVEFYEAYGDYTDGMKIFEEIWATAAQQVAGSTKITYQDTEIDFTAPWKRISFVDALKKYADIDANKRTKKDLQSYCDKNEIEYNKNAPKGILLDYIFDAKCQKNLIQPTFVIDFPIETTPLCKPLRNGNTEFVERFEPYVYGWEVGNAYSELNDPILQRKLLMEQAERGRAGDEEFHPMDEDFVKAIEFGMPPTSGVGIGVDRMVMLLTNSYSIRDVIFFPLLRPEKPQKSE